MYIGTSYSYADTTKLFSGCLAVALLLLPNKLQNSAVVNDLS